MNKYLKEFLHRGLIFSGLGPIVLSIIYFILSKNIDGFSLSGKEILLGTVSVYLLAFLQAGATVFNQIEEWPITKSLLCHFSTLYLAYALCYIVNSWIPFVPEVLLIFTLIFILVYLVIWFTVFISVRAFSTRANQKLN